LTIHPDKTRSVPFERPDRAPEQSDAEQRESPGTFDLLAFTHLWSLSLQGRPVVKRKTSPSRFNQGLKSIADWCRVNRHRPLATQQHTLCQKQTGHYAYDRITGNCIALSALRWAVVGIWRK
jgi:hypothetical protein